MELGIRKKVMRKEVIVMKEIKKIWRRMEKTKRGKKYTRVMMSGRSRVKVMKIWQRTEATWRNKTAEKLRRLWLK